MVLAIFLISLLAVSAVSAADDADAPAIGDVGDDTIVEAPVDEVIEEQAVEASSGDEVGDSDSDPWADRCIISERGINWDDPYSSVVIMHWPENTSISEQSIMISYNGTLHRSKTGPDDPFNDKGYVIINGNGEAIKRLTVKDLGFQITDEYSHGSYDITVSHNERVIKESGILIMDGPRAGVHYRDLAKYDFDILKTRVELDDEDAVIFNFTFPTYEDETSLQVEVTIICDEVWNAIGQDTVALIGIYEANGTNMDVTLKRLGIIEPGTYTLIVNDKCFIKKFDLEVTHNYTADEFIDIDDQVTRLDFPVCTVTDPTRSGLKGTVSVYADGNKVYSEKLSAGKDDYIYIFLDNMTGAYYNGNYKIKVVYEKSDGNTYSAEKVVEFVGISDIGNIPTTITASSISTVYNTEKYLVATLKDDKSNPISDVNIYIGVMGVEFPVTTDKNGQIKYNLVNLPPQKHAVTLTFKGNEKYFNATKKVTVTVNKLTPKLTAKAITFKKSVKTKKYTITLKDNKNKVMKNKKVYIKVNKKTYSANTNNKGVATFKITKLTKVGKYTATVTYKGDAYYNKLAKNVKITVK